MSFDKDDLLRNVIPGYVFLIVILSFYACANGLDRIQAVPKDLLIAVGGIPIGFIIQSLYRVWHRRFEQALIEQKEARILNPKIRKKVMERIKANKILSNIKRRKIVSQWLAISLNRKENDSFAKRVNFLMSLIHSLGASCLAILLASTFMVIFKIQYFGFCLFENFSSVPVLSLIYHWRCSFCPLVVVESFWSFLICFLGWVIVGGILFFSRAKILIDYSVSRKIFIAVAKLDEGQSWLLLAPSGNDREIL